MRTPSPKRFLRQRIACIDSPKFSRAYYYRRAGYRHDARHFIFNTAPPPRRGRQMHRSALRDRGGRGCESSPLRSLYICMIESVSPLALLRRNFHYWAPSIQTCHAERAQADADAAGGALHFTAAAARDALLFLARFYFTVTLYRRYLTPISAA